MLQKHLRIAVLLSLLPAGASCGQDLVGGRLFRCRTQDDCGRGWRCVACTVGGNAPGVCVREDEAPPAICAPGDAWTDTNAGGDLDPTTEVAGEDVGLWDPGPDATRCGSELDCDEDAPFCHETLKVCVACRSVWDCHGDGYCLEGRCRPDLVCQPDARSCRQNRRILCNASGTSETDEDCGENACHEGECVACAPGSVDCPEVNIARQCRLDGSGWQETLCGEMRCVNGQCVSCVPGYRVCQGTSVMECEMDGSAFGFVEDCDPEGTGRMCHLGSCWNPCEYNAKYLLTNQGCDYWATDLDQYRESSETTYGGGENAPYAIVVSNIDATFKAKVRVTSASGYDKTYEALPRTVTIIDLPPNNISGSGISDHAWHVTSTLPIVAYQFNPLENVGVYSNDASLLMPSLSLGREYRVLSFPTIGMNSDGQQLASFLTVVAVEDGTTEVTVTPTADVAAGASVQAIPAKAARNFTLHKGQVLNLEASKVGGDLTGSLVQATGKVAVFGGHVCSNAPVSRCTNGKCSYDPSVTCTVDSDCPAIAACDHLEEQMPPLGTAGRQYVIARAMPRGKAPDLVRVLAIRDGTQIVTTASGITIPRLDAGAWHEFEITDHVELSSDKAFLVGHFLEGQNAPYSAHSSCINTTSQDLCEAAGGTCSCYDMNSGILGVACSRQNQCSDDANIGDPSLILGVPTEQFRTEYVFLVPTKFRYNHVSIVAPVGAKVTLDGEGVNASTFQVTASNQWKVARITMQPGAHVLNSDRKVGIEVYGWDFYVSYGYPGGMNLQVLSAF